MLIRILLALFLSLSLQENRELEEYRETFNTSTLDRPWKTEYVNTPAPTINQESLVFYGEFPKMSEGISSGEIRAYVPFKTADFFSLEMDVRVNAVGTPRAGIFLGYEKSTGATSQQILGQIAISRRADGVMENRLITIPVDEKNPAPPWSIPASTSPDSTVCERPTAKTFRLGIARVSGKPKHVSITIDGKPFFEGEAPFLENTANTLNAGFFIEGPPGSKYYVVIDNVLWKYYLKRR